MLLKVPIDTSLLISSGLHPKFFFLLEGTSLIGPSPNVLKHWAFTKIEA
jgi:hypothetical protein